MKHYLADLTRYLPALAVALLVGVLLGAGSTLLVQGVLVNSRQTPATTPVPTPTSTASPTSIAKSSPTATASPSPTTSPIVAAVPSHRLWAAAAFDESHKVVVMFGGTADGGGAGVLGDTWIWDGKEWVQLHPAHSPPPRYGAGMAYYPTHAVILLFGGMDARGPRNDTWIWNGSDWSQPALTVSPPALPDPQMAPFPPQDELILGFYSRGGSAAPSDFYAWRLNGWTDIGGANGPPDLTKSPWAMAYHQPSHRLVLVGHEGTALYNASYDGSRWDYRPTSGPTALEFVLAPDEITGTLTLFGTTGTYTWWWNGVVWDTGALSSAPPARRGATMVYDGARQLDVLVGGGVSGFDTWTWESGKRLWKQVA